MPSRSIIYLISFVFLCRIASAQYVENEPAKTVLKKWHLSQFDFGLGIDNDHYGSMSLNELMAFAENPEEMERDLSGLSEEAVTVTRGGAFYSNISFSPLNKTGDAYRMDRELRLGLGLHSPKEAMLSYKNKDRDTSIVYCNIQSELTLEGAFLFKGTWGKKERWHWYYGIGANVGTSFDNAMVLIAGKYFEEGEHPSEQEADEMNMTKYAAKPVYYSRLYVPYGIGYGIGKKWIVGLDFKTGMGIQKIQGEKANAIRKTGAFIIGAKYRFY